MSFWYQNKTSPNCSVHTNLNCHVERNHKLDCHTEQKIPGSNYCTWSRYFML